jgi:hypothetical protein
MNSVALGALPGVPLAVSPHRHAYTKNRLDETEIYGLISPLEFPLRWMRRIRSDQAGGSTMLMEATSSQW